MKILALDPSSTKTGYAVADGGEIIDFGVLTPNRTKDPPNTRIWVMLMACGDLMNEHRPFSAVVIEDTSGKIAGRLGRASGLAIHGKAVGMFIMKAVQFMGGTRQVHLVLENDWTRGTPKAKRQKNVAYLLGDKYDPAKDPGGDVADAIGLLNWWMDKQKLNPAASPALFAEAKASPPFSRRRKHDYQQRKAP